MISGCIGPEGDGYSSPRRFLSADEARDYHSTQIGSFADTAADMVTAITMTYPDEAIGIVRAAAEAGMPAVVSFTVETDGRLPNGQPLGEAITEVDEKTDGGPCLLHDQLRASRRISHRSSRPTGRGGSGSAASRRTRRPRATPSSTRRPSWTRATPPISAPATRRFTTTCPASTSSAAAAAPTTATSARSATPGWRSDLGERGLRPGGRRCRRARRGPSRPTSPGR